jgi:hypothetical protein
MQQLADGDHRAGNHRHGGIDQRYVTTMHDPANLAPPRAGVIPQRE